MSDALDRPRRMPGCSSMHDLSAPRVLDLFCGAAGGWSLGLHWAGYETVAACEADPWRRQLFLANNPRVRMYDDVRHLTAAQLVADECVPEVVVGSPPCQDISCANPFGQGVDGERSGLFFEACRIVTELAQAGCGPRWICLENSPRLRTRGADRVLGALEDAGYTCHALVVGAHHIGAPHVRNRVWIVANAKEVGQGRRAHPTAEGRQKRGQPGGGAAADTNQVGRCPRRMGSLRHGGECETAARDPGVLGHHWFAGIATHRRSNDGLSAGVSGQCVAAYGDAVVPAIPWLIGRAILAIDPVLGWREAE